ncbi:hypothetical protein D3C71_1345230 [compost metagenome]
MDNPVTLIVRFVRPCSPLSSAMNPLRPVCSRASSSAPSFASEPLFTKNVRLRFPGSTDSSRSASSTLGSVKYTVVVCCSRRSCSIVRSVIAGLQWPQATTDTPAKKSVYFFPFSSYTCCMLPRTNCGESR